MWSSTLLTLMRKPFTQLDILGLSSEGEEIAFDRAFGIFLVEEFLIRALAICVLIAQS
jgi:hypothetical protein